MISEIISKIDPKTMQKISPKKVSNKYAKNNNLDTRFGSTKRRRFSILLVVTSFCQVWGPKCIQNELQKWAETKNPKMTQNELHKLKQNWSKINFKPRAGIEIKPGNQNYSESSPGIEIKPRMLKSSPGGLAARVDIEPWGSKSSRGGQNQGQG